jgi:hypothetical protein
MFAHHMGIYSSLCGTTWNLASKSVNIILIFLSLLPNIHLNQMAAINAHELVKLHFRAK